MTRRLRRAIELAASTHDANPNIIAIVRELCYSTRGIAPEEAGVQARFAMLVARKALDETADEHRATGETSSRRGLMLAYFNLTTRRRQPAERQSTGP